MLGNGRCPSCMFLGPKLFPISRLRKMDEMDSPSHREELWGNPPKMMMSRYFGANNIISPAVFWQTFNKRHSGGRTVLTDSNHQCPLWLISSCQCDQLQNWEEMSGSPDEPV